MKTNVKNQHFVFYDEKNIRWKILVFFVLVITSFIIVIYTNLVKSIQNVNAVTKNVNDSAVSPAPTAIANKTASLTNYGYANAVTPPITKPSNENINKFTFYVNWDEDSFNSLKRNLNLIDTLIPEWVYLADTNGTIGFYNLQQQTTVSNYVKSNNANTKIIPLVSNYNQNSDEFNMTILTSILTNAAPRETLINNLLNYVKSNNYAGINIDFEDIPPETQNYYVLFMQELAGKFKEAGLITIQDLPVNNVDYNYSVLGQLSDYIILMFYDYSWGTGVAGAISPQEWFTTTLNSFTNVIPANKLWVAAGAYGYDWNLSTKAPAESLTFEETMSRLEKYHAQIETDPLTLNPHFKYMAENMSEHEIWYLDSVTFYNQFLAANQFNIGGFGFWRLGSEDSNVWTVYNNRTDLNNIKDKLATVTTDLSIISDGAGEILKVETGQNPGRRDLTLDENTKFIIGQQILEYATPYEVKRWDAVNPKFVALTFDDGPDPLYTPKILKVLKDNQITGTFFIIGSQANLHPEIVKTMYDNGNEIGNHTFSHPNISSMTPEQVQFETNATQKLIESITGRSTKLFRPPFGEDSEPKTSQEMKSLILIGDMDYYTVSMNIDPHDWGMPSAEQITNRIINQVNSGKGNIILLHDGGGNRSQTLEALPTVIQNLKSAGYEFVNISTLMGLTKDEVMPVVHRSQNNPILLNDLGFYMVTAASFIVRNLFWLGIILGVSRMLIILILAVIQKIKTANISYSKQYKPSVSIIVPAWNEGKVVINTVNALLQSDYPINDIIVVDDGSKDNTYTITKNTFKNNPKVKVFRKQNEGKSSALNFGIKASTSEIVIIQDADSLFEPDAVSKLVRHFKDKRVAAVAGNIKVGNRINPITKLQALEYAISQNLDRRAFHVLNAITVVPGAIGAWRREVVLKAGGFYSDTLAEDAEITFRVLQMKYRIVYEEDAIAYTEAPDTISVFLKQRFRWMFGMTQTTWKHINLLFSVKNPSMGFVMLPNMIIFQILFPAISPLLDVFTLASIGLAYWQKSIHVDVSFDTFYNILAFYIFYTVLDVFTIFAAFMLEKRESKLMLIYIPLQRIFYRYLMYIVSIKSVFTILKGPYVRWELKDRKGTVTNKSLGLALSSIKVS